MAWTDNEQPFGVNHAPTLVGTASDGSGKTVPVAVDKDTGELLVSGAAAATSVAINDGVTTTTKSSVVASTATPGENGIVVLNPDGTNLGGGTQYTDGVAAPTHPVGTMPIFNNGGTWAEVSASQGLPVTQIVSAQDLVDSGNSTTATLTSGSTFTGTGHTTLGYAFIQVIVYSDQNSATLGVQIQFSPDNVTWNDSSEWTFTAGGSSPNNGQTYGAAARAQYYRIVYTNGSTNQTVFKLNTVLKNHSTAGDMVTMSTVPNSTNHALLSKSSIVGLTTGGGGGFVDVKVNPSGSLTTASSTLDGSGNAITSNSTTTSATTGLDMNLRSILNTAPTTPGFLDIKGADGNVFVRQATAANLNATVVGTGTFAVQATQSGTWTVTQSGTWNVGTISAAVNTGQQTSNTSAVQLSASSTVPTNGIIVRALAGNVANVYIGGSSVTTSTGYELTPGESISFTCNLNTLYVIGSNSTDKVCWNVQ
jgi:hypothetical protein